MMSKHPKMANLLNCEYKENARETKIATLYGTCCDDCIATLMWYPLDGGVDC